MLAPTELAAPGGFMMRDSGDGLALMRARSEKGVIVWEQVDVRNLTNNPITSSVMETLAILKESQGFDRYGDLSYEGDGKKPEVPREAIERKRLMEAKLDLRTTRGNS